MRIKAPIHVQPCALPTLAVLLNLVVVVVGNLSKKTANCLHYRVNIVQPRYWKTCLLYGIEGCMSTI